MTRETRDESNERTDEEYQKKLIKEAFQEYLDEQITAFSWWALRSILLAIVAGAIAFIIWTNHVFGKS